MEPVFSFEDLPQSVAADHCWCCGSILTTKGACPICDMAGLMSPPHICARSGRLISDEDDSPAEFTMAGPDHETTLRGEAPHD